MSAQVRPKYFPKYRCDAWIVISERKISSMSITLNSKKVASARGSGRRTSQLRKQSWANSTRSKSQNHKSLEHTTELTLTLYLKSITETDRRKVQMFEVSIRKVDHKCSALLQLEQCWWGQPWAGPRSRGQMERGWQRVVQERLEPGFLPRNPSTCRPHGPCWCEPASCPSDLGDQSLPLQLCWDNHYPPPGRAREPTKLKGLGELVWLRLE